MDNVQTSRRGVLGALSLATLAGGAVFAAIPAAGSRDRTAWDRALDRYEKAKAAYDRHHNTVWRTAWNQAEREMPWGESEGRFTITARSGQTVTYRLDRNNLDEYADHFSKQYREAAATAKANYIKRQDVEARLKIKEIAAEADRLSVAMNQAELEVQLMPAPDLMAVLWKLDHLFGDEVRDQEDDFIDPWHHKFTDAILDDVRRLTAGGLN